MNYFSRSNEYAGGFVYERGDLIIFLNEEKQEIIQ